MPRIAVSAAALCALGGCALHDWSDFSSGAVSGPDGGVAIPEAGADAPATTTADAGDAAPGDRYGTVVAADAPMTWFRFDEAPGAVTVVDSVGGRNGNVLGSTPTFGQPGLSGSGVLMSGRTSLDLGNVYSFEGKVPFTLEAWLKTDSTGEDQRLFYKRQDLPEPQPSIGYVMYLAGNNSPHFEMSPVPMSSWGDAPIPAKEFVHLVVVVSYETGKGNAAFWVNGARVENHGYDNTQSLPSSPVSLAIGDHVNGVLDEVAIYDHPLSQPRILQHYLAGIGQ